MTPFYPYKWFAIEKWLLGLVYPTTRLILKAKGDLDSLDCIAGVLDDTGWLARPDFLRYMEPGNYTYLMLDLTLCLVVMENRVILVNSNAINVETYIQLYYMALVGSRPLILFQGVSHRQSDFRPTMAECRHIVKVRVKWDQKYVFWLSY